nr:MAG TPA: triphosphate pyrophosphohydrolase [Caudoviricetes sp.]
MTQIDKLRVIRDHLSEEDILCQLAEEAAEVSQAALKLRRAITRTNPTPIDAETAKNKLLEEIADVVITLDVMMGDADWNVIWAFSVRKLDRWVERLKGTANTNCAADTPTDAPTASKTRQERFIEMFPRAIVFNGALNICPGDIDARQKCHGPKDCRDCRREYWLEEVEDDGN